jgi:ergothioneine biosynthesis protein EgtB
VGDDKQTDNRPRIIRTVRIESEHSTSDGHMTLVHSEFAPQVLATKLQDARTRLKRLCQTLAPEDWLGPYATTINPPLWEFGHIVWFQEHWCLRLKPGTDPAASPLLEPLLPARRPWADWLYNSSRIPHAARWRAPLPSPQESIAYGDQVLSDVSEKLDTGSFDDSFRYYAELCLYHELMHTEAWWMMWQERGLSPPAVPTLPSLDAARSLAVPRGRVTLGSTDDAGFVFDNEKWAHEVGIDAFEIDAYPVTCGAFAEFVADGGYTHPSLWSTAGRAWLAKSSARNPLYWRQTGNAWQVRRFDRWIDLDPGEPVIHVSRFEAEAYCAWRGRTLPSTAQWLRAYDQPGFTLGRCWEWTCDMFDPYAGFSPDPYTDYSVPWFHTHAEVRGAGSWVTDAALARPTYRNFFNPERRDPFIGFRTLCSAND